MAITIPDYRFFSGATLTVPANETWVINQLAPPAGLGIVQVLTIATINGNSYFLYANVFENGGGTNPVLIDPVLGNSFGGKLVLKAGDTIAVNLGTFDAYYWIIETDFPEIDGSVIPNLRNVQLTAAGSITVPGGETWVVMVACCGIAGRDAGTTPPVNSWYVTGGFTQNSNAITTVNGGGVIDQVFGSHDVGFARSIIANPIVLQAGDSIDWTRYTIVTGTLVRNTLDVGYYKLGVDFS